MSPASRSSAGLLPYRRHGGRVEVMLVHPGGPFFASKDAGAWSIAKGELEAGEDPLAAAQREFREETGFEPREPYIALGKITQKSGKRVEAWGFEAEFDAAALHSNCFELEWPPRSGRRQLFPEVDRAAWFARAEAETKLNPAQIPLLVRLFEELEKSSE